MRIRLDRIVIRDFKRIEVLEIELRPVTALVGGNTSGKSSALQAAQLGVSMLQASYRRKRANGLPEFVGTLANDDVLFRPTEPPRLPRRLHLLRGWSNEQDIKLSERSA